MMYVLCVYVMMTDDVCVMCVYNINITHTKTQKKTKFFYEKTIQKHINTINYNQSIKTNQ